MDLRRREGEVRLFEIVSPWTFCSGLVECIYSFNHMKHLRKYIGVIIYALYFVTYKTSILSCLM